MKIKTKNPIRPNTGYMKLINFEKPILAKGIEMIQNIPDTINLFLLLENLFTKLDPLAIAVVNMAHQRINA